MSSPLSPREAGILHSIVEAYIHTGEPVGSLSLARLRRMKLSAASIRNVMADLAEQGLLSQPHTSAGRIPTERAIESYVKTLAVRVVSAELSRLRTELRRAQTVEERIECSTRILTDLTHNVAIVSSVPGSGQILREVQFVAIPGERLLIVVVTGDGRVHNRVIELDQPVADGELVTLRNYLNQNFSGWELPVVRRELSRRLELESAAYDTVLRRLSELRVHGLLDLALDAEVFVGGASNLVGIDLHLTREAMRDIFRTLEQKKRLIEILDRFLDKNSDELGVQVGLADVHPSMSQLSLIGVSIAQPGGTATRMAVLGPLRMDYAKALSAVVHMQQALRALPS